MSVTVSDSGSLADFSVIADGNDCYLISVDFGALYNHWGVESGTTPWVQNTNPVAADIDQWVQPVFWYQNVSTELVISVFYDTNDLVTVVKAASYSADSEAGDYSASQDNNGYWTVFDATTTLDQSASLSIFSNENLIFSEHLSAHLESSYSSSTDTASITGGALVQGSSINLEPITLYDPFLKTPYFNTTFGVGERRGWYCYFRDKAGDYAYFGVFRYTPTIYGLFRKQTGYSVVMSDAMGKFSSTQSEITGLAIYATEDIYSGTLLRSVTPIGVV